MTRSLYAKLVLSFLVISVMGTALVGVLFWSQTSRAFGDYVVARGQRALIEGLASYYDEQGSWFGVERLVLALREQDGLGAEALARAVVVDGAGRVIIPGSRHHIGDVISLFPQPPGEPILVDAQVVGYFVVDRWSSPSRGNAMSMLFQERVNTVLVQATIGATVLALLLSVFVSRSLTRPLRELTRATRAVAAGDLTQKVPVRSHDELGELAASFNHMNEELARSQDLRHQMTADVAHDLRTPLSIILGHAEALSDGALPPSPETFDIIYDEAKHLTRLVEDLRTLTLADARELTLYLEDADPASLVVRVAAAHSVSAQGHGIAIETHMEPPLPSVNLDVDRITQVLDNLIENALRYTPEGGKIILSALGVGHRLRFTVEDTGPGVSAEEIGKLFERFYRIDKSRQRNGSGSGLGLAISRSIVESHGGELWAENRAEGGLRCVIDLPTVGDARRRDGMA